MIRPYTSDTPSSHMAVKRQPGTSRSPVVSAAVARLHHTTRARAGLQWGVISSITIIVLLFDMYFGVVGFLTHFNYQLILVVESILLLILFLSLLYDIVYYCGVVLFNPKLKLTTKQKTMLGMSSEVNGIETVSTPVQFGITTPPRKPNKTTPPIATPFSVGVSPSYYHTSSPGSTYGTPSHTPSRSPGLNTSLISDRISTKTSLDQYLKSEEEKDRRTLNSPDNAMWYTPSNGGTTNLRKYHVATRTLSPSNDEEGYEIDKIWSKLHIKQYQLNELTARCRKWLAQTVVIPVAREIELINKTLKSIGSTELTIGSASLHQLQDIARIRTQLLPSLNMLIRYLDVSLKQDYLVKRIAELAEGTSISNYQWNGGGSWKGRKWSHDLPSDSQIVFHFLCTYLDSHLPPSPQFPDGKTFTNQYFIKTPDNPVNKKARVSIYQSSINPPHYKVLCKENIIDIPKGRDNLFYVFIVFLHYIKHEQDGLLGHVDLQLSGLNLLWIIDSKSS